MNSQLKLFHGGTFQMGSGEAVRIDAVGGELAVVSGRVWLTRFADAQDHALSAGQRVLLAAADGAVVEPLHHDQAAVLEWKPGPQRQVQTQRLAALAGRLAAAPLRGAASVAGALALVLRGVEAGLAALARRAASSAKRAQLCINAGDSMASSGALK